MADARQKLVGLLDYIEQVVRLDERVAFRLSEYRLSDGTSFAVSKNDTQNLPGVRHDHRDQEGPVWLEVERLARKEPPSAPENISEWIVVTADPARSPEVRVDRLVTVNAAERDAAVASGAVRPDDVLEAPRKRNESGQSPPLFDLKLRLEDRPKIAAAINQWIEGPWAEWSAEELPRRRTIALYQVLYKIFQLLEVGGAESAIELIWGIGVVQWQKEGRIVDRPLLERRVDIELDEKRAGLIRVRPTGADALFDLKPYEELGCESLPSLADRMRREIQRASDNEGISPFVRQSFELILSAAGVRLHREGCYMPDAASGAAASVTAERARLTVTDKWVLFARPRSQHVVLQDIDRLRRSAEDEDISIEGLPKRLVTEPSCEAPQGAWEPLSTRIGASAGGTEAPVPDNDELDVFFPKPFNDDQLEIIRRLSRADGLVVQGPPGTGKTHTIANLICHAMATGQRVLVVSRGEAALAVLKQQLPAEVQPLAIAVLSNEREGLRQVESAIREIQGVVEGAQPQNRRAMVARLEQELDGLRKRVGAIDQELDAIASAHLTKIGPRSETPAELAQRVVADREAFRWFVDRPLLFASETGLEDRSIAALFEARIRCGELIDHLNADLPSPLDLPDSETVVRWHDDLIASSELGEAAGKGPARVLRISAEFLPEALALARTLDDLVRAHHAAETAQWIEPFRLMVLKGKPNGWCDRLRECIAEWLGVDAERAALLQRSVELPDGLVDNADACEAVRKGAKGQKTWPLTALHKRTAKALVGAILLDGTPLKEENIEGWCHTAAVITNAARQREVSARWNAIAREISAPAGANAKSAVDLAEKLLRTCDEARSKSALLASLVADAFSIEVLANDPQLCGAAAKQIRAAATSARLASAEVECRRVLHYFHGDDRTSELARQFIGKFLGKPSLTPEKVSSIWKSLLSRLVQIKELALDFGTIEEVTKSIAALGAPEWARTLRVRKSCARRSKSFRSVA